MDQIHGSDPWIWSMDQIHGSDLWIRWNVTESTNVGQNRSPYLVFLYNLPTVPLGQVDVLRAILLSIISSHLSPLCSIYPMFRLLNPSPGDAFSGAIFDQNPCKLIKKRWIPWFVRTGTPLKRTSVKRWSKKWYSNVWAKKSEQFPPKSSCVLWTFAFQR